MAPTITLARRFWMAIEPIHAISYFAPEPAEAAKRIGLRGFWMGYFAGRVAPLGAVPAPAVCAMAYGFAPSMVSRAIPDAWRFASPELILQTRIESSATALRTHIKPEMVNVVAELSDYLWDAVEGCQFDGRPLAAGWSNVIRPSDPVADAWLATTILREHRGDGHVLAGVAAGLRGIDATLALVATGAITRDLIQPSRGWTDEDWAQSLGRLQTRGLLDQTGRLTKSGEALRRELEAVTDRLAVAPVERLGESGVERVIEMAAPVSRHLIDSRIIPIPNPIGLPRA